MRSIDKWQIITELETLRRLIWKQEIQFHFDVFTWHISYLVTILSGYFYLSLFWYLKWISSRHILLDLDNFFIQSGIFNHLIGMFMPVLLYVTIDMVDLKFINLIDFLAVFQLSLIFFLFINLPLDWIMFMVYILCHCWVIIYSLSKIYIVYNIQLTSSSGVARYINIKKVYIRWRNSTGDREKL